jgi:HEPN pEK499 p136
MTEIKPEEKVARILERTLFNLSFINDHAHDAGPYEMTQLINSFLGAVVHPWENLLRNQPILVNLRGPDVNWPALRKAKPTDDNPLDFHESLAWIRHAFAHGNITYLNADGKIWGIEIRNKGYSKRQKKYIDWGTRLDKTTLRCLLDSYVEIARRVDDAVTSEVSTSAAD